jgi:hypothetical protein
VPVLESQQAKRETGARPVAVPITSLSEPRKFVPSGQPIDIMDLKESDEETTAAPKSSGLKFRPASQVR